MPVDPLYEGLDDLFGGPAPARQVAPRRRQPIVRPPRPIAEPETEPEISSLRRYLAMGARGAGALAGFTPWTGAAGGALGEAAGQAIEQGTIDPRELDYSQIAGQAAAGATGGKFVSLLGKLGGQPLKAMAQGAFLGGAAPVVRDVIAEGELPEAREVAIGAGLGGATGGVLSKFLGLPKVAGPVVAKPQITRGPEMFQDVLERGPRTMAPETMRTPYVSQGVAEDSPRVAKIVAAEQKTAKTAAEEAANAERIAEARQGLEPGTPRVSKSYAAKLPGGGTERMSVSYKPVEEVDELGTLLGGDPLPQARTVHPAQPEAPISTAPAATPAEGPLTTVVPGELPFSPGRLRTPEQAEANRILGYTDDVIDVPPAASGAMVPAGPPAPPQRPFATISRGGVTVGAPLGADPADAQAILAQQLGEEAPAAAPAAAEAASPLAQFFKTRVGATGKNYRQAKEAAEQGQIPTANLAREAHLREQAALKGPSTPKAGKAATATDVAPPGAAAGIPEDVAAAQQAADLERVTGELQTPATGPSMSPAAIQEELDFIEGTKLLRGGKFGKGVGATPEAPPVGAAAPEAPVPPADGPRLVKKPGERGGVPVELMARLGLGAAGAAVGAATDPLDDPLLSGLAGGAVGMSLPNMAAGLQKLGADPKTLGGVMPMLESGTPEGVKQAVSTLGRLLPQFQRFNYLMGSGLPANAIVGPTGAVLFGGLERALSGDPRGWAVLREISSPSGVKNIIGEWQSALEEAKSFIGRGEGGAFSEASDMAERAFRAPGTAMATGDVMAKRILMRNGFTEAEAAEMTLTSTPFTKTGKSASELEGFVSNMLFPFRRTPIDVAEQGALRTPGLGSMLQAVGAGGGRRAADPLRQQAVQQGLGVGVGVGAEQIGENLPPDQARMMRRYITNLAGPYGLPAAIGMAVGTGRQAGRSIPSSLATGIPRELPMPSIDSVQDWAQFLRKSTEGQEAELPRGAYPGLIRDYSDFFEKHRPAEPLLPRKRRP